MSLQHQINNEDAVLLMYLADELSAEERAAVDARLAGDPRMRAAVVEMQASTNGIASVFAQADRHPASAMEESRRAAAVRRVSRAMVKQHVIPAVQLPERADDIPRRFLPRWSYPFAAAAIIIVGLVSIVQWGGSNIADQALQRRPNDFGNWPGSDSSGDRRAAREAFVEAFQDEAFGIDNADRNTIALSSRGYDVSSMFQPESK